MTAPTQAQIKAARLVMPAIAHEFVYEEDVAQMLTAAAQVGETFDDGYKYKEAECLDEIAATIERCAQVAEKVELEQAVVSFDLAHIVVKRIAAAIRKLKEEA